MSGIIEIKGLKYSVDSEIKNINMSIKDENKVEYTFEDYFNKKSKDLGMELYSVSLDFNSNDYLTVVTTFNVGDEEIFVYFDYGNNENSIKLFNIEYVDNDGNIEWFNGDNLDECFESIKKDYGINKLIKSSNDYKSEVDAYLSKVKSELGNEIKFKNVKGVKAEQVRVVGNQKEFKFKYPFVYLGWDYIAIVTVFEGDGDLEEGIDGLKLICLSKGESEEGGNLVLLDEFITELKAINKIVNKETVNINDDKYKEKLGKKIDKYLLSLSTDKYNIKSVFDKNLKLESGKDVLRYKVFLNDAENGIVNDNILDVDVKLNDKKGIEKLGISAIDGDGKKVAVTDKNCWLVVSLMLLSRYDLDDSEDGNKVKVYKGAISENNKKESVKKITLLKEYLDVIRVPNELKETKELGKVLLVGFNQDLKFYISSSIIYDVENNKVVVKKDDAGSIVDYLKEFNLYISKLIDLKSNKSMMLLLTIFNTLFINSFDLRKAKLDERFIMQEVEVKKNKIKRG